MVLTPTMEKELGFIAPEFELIEPLTGQMRKLSDLKSEKATLIMFICNHCPYVLHILEELCSIADDYIPHGISVIAINSNDVSQYPEDSPEKMKELILKYKIGFRYLYDESQDVAKAYDAACTPDFNIFDKDLKCVYRGQLDDSRPGNGIPVTGKDIRSVLDTLLDGKKLSNIEQKPSIGCSIKWKE